MRGAGARVATGAALLGAVLLPQVVSSAYPGLHAWLIDHWALEWGLVAREPWRLFLSSLVQPRPGLVGTEWAFAIVVIPAAAALWPWWALLLGFWGADLVGTLPVLAGLRLAAAWSPLAADLVSEPDAGSSAGLFGLGVLVAWRLPRAVSFAVLGGIALFTAGRLVLFHRVFDVEHLIAVVATASVLGVTYGLPGRVTGSKGGGRRRRTFGERWGRREAGENGAARP